MKKVYCKDCRFYCGIEDFLEPDLSLAHCEIPRQKKVLLNWLEKDGESFTIPSKEEHYCAIQNEDNRCKLYVPKKPPQQKHVNRKPFMEFLRGGV